MSTRNHRRRHGAALAATLVLAALALGLPACSQHKSGSQGEPAGRHPAVEQDVTEVDLKRGQGAGPRVQLEVAADARLGTSGRAQLAAAARRFATSLAGWLYGDRREIAVEPVAPEVRRELANAPPYVPSDQIRSRDGRAVQIRVSVQTPGSGVLVVTIRDSRTTYQIPASFERRAGRWQVVHLNTD